MSESEKLTATKLLLYLGILFMIADAVIMFYNSANPYELLILYGILELVLAAVVFLSLDLVSLGPVKIPYKWWILLIVGVILLIFGVLVFPFIGDYQFLFFSGILVVMAALLEWLLPKKDWKAHKIMLLLGIAFAFYDCILLIIGYSTVPASPGVLKIWLTNAIFGIILLVLLILSFQDWFDAKIPFTWWTLLTVGFVFFLWVSPGALLVGVFGNYPISGFGGIIILISWILMLL
ncbi:MAG: hypothetical protein ACFFCI_07775 [Promethearchaeota archaeon]